MQPGDFLQEGVVVERQAVGDLVEHGELGPAQQIGLPERQHLASQLLVAGRGFVLRQRDAFTAIKQRCDLHLAVHRALTADLGRVRGQNRADLGLLEKAPQLVGADSGALGESQRLRQHAGAAGLGRGPGAHLADVVLVLGDVGEVGEIAEGADDPHRLGGRHAVEDLLELTPGDPILIAVEPDRGLPDTLDQVEHISTLLVAHRVAQDAPEQSDIVAQPRISLQRLGVLRSVGTMICGVGWYGLKGHGSLPGSSSRNCPAQPSVQVFCRSAR